MTRVDYDAELQRHNQVLRWTYGIRPHDHVLDIGCGAGQTTRDAARMAKPGVASGVNVSASMIERARRLTDATGLSNVSFRARAQVVRLEIEYGQRTLHIVVRDDGRGMGPYEVARASGAGLCGMEARAKTIGARLRVRSRPGAGTEIALSVPGAVAYTAAPAGGK